MFFPGLGLSLLFSIALCLHVARTGQSLWWMVIILILQPLGGIVYLAFVVVPELLGSARTRRFGAEAARALDPDREHRIARRAAQESPTVHNQLRLAKAAQALGRHAEAEEVFREAMVGIHADDPVLILGRATSLIELGRVEEAQALMVKLDELGEEARTPAAALAWARILEALGRTSEAEKAYRDAAERL
ncbi:MAG: tetratricopeptide repeat protein, partial [Caulobacteraceae bacterium]